MGIFDWLTGSTNDTTNSTSASNHTNSTSIGTSEQTGNTTSANKSNVNSSVDSITGQMQTGATTNNQNTDQQIKQTSTQHATTESHQQVQGTTLSKDELATLDQAAALVNGNGATALAGNPTSGDATDLAKGLVARAQGTPGVYDTLAQAATDAATHTFDTRTRGDIANVAAKSGSSDSSFAQLLLNRGETDLSTNIAQIVANLGVQGEQAQSGELATALQGLIAGGTLGVNEQSGAAQALSSLLGTAKGGATTTTSTSSTVSDLLQTMLQEATTATSGGGTSSANTTGTNVGFSSTGSTSTSQQISDLVNQAAQANVSDSNSNQTTNSTTQNSGSVLDIFKTLAAFGKK